MNVADYVHGFNEVQVAVQSSGCLIASLAWFVGANCLLEPKDIHVTVIQECSSPTPMQAEFHL